MYRLAVHRFHDAVAQTVVRKRRWRRDDLRESHQLRHPLRAELLLAPFQFEELDRQRILRRRAERRNVRARQRLEKQPSPHRVAGLLARRVHAVETALHRLAIESRHHLARLALAADRQFERLSLRLEHAQHRARVDRSVERVRAAPLRVDGQTVHGRDDVPHRDARLFRRAAGFDLENVDAALSFLQAEVGAEDGVVQIGAADAEHGGARRRSVRLGEEARDELGVDAEQRLRLLLVARRDADETTVADDGQTIGAPLWHGLGDLQVEARHHALRRAAFRHQRDAHRHETAHDAEEVRRVPQAQGIAQLQGFARVEDGSVLLMRHRQQREIEIAVVAQHLGGRRARTVRKADLHVGRRLHAVAVGQHLAVPQVDAHELRVGGLLLFPRPQQVVVLQGGGDAKQICGTLRLRSGRGFGGRLLPVLLGSLRLLVLGRARGDPGALLLSRRARRGLAVGEEKSGEGDGRQDAVHDAVRKVRVRKWSGPGAHSWRVSCSGDVSSTALRRAGSGMP